MQSFFIQTFGCQMNYADSDRVRVVLERAGLHEVNTPEQADVIILNTCNVRQKPADKAFGYQKILRDLNKKQKRIWVIMGCLVKQTSTREDEKRDPLFAKLSNLDIALRVEDLGQLPSLLGLGEGMSGDYLNILPKFEGLTAYIPIMTGCNNFCSYCIVPYTRGRERSRSVADILAECKKALAEGAKEIVLLGQNVNSYAYDFPNLLRQVNTLPGEFWLWFTSSHPKDCTPELIEAMRDCEKVRPHLHLPVQNGNDKTLERMNRKYATSDYRQIVAKYRELFPEGSLTSDWIVGFCGETDQDFVQSLDFMREMRFDQVYFAQYNERPGTFATENLDDNVSPEVKNARWHTFNTEMKKVSFEINQSYVGQECEMLVEQVHDGELIGRIAQDKPVFCKAEGQIGDFLKVKIIKTKDWRLWAEKLAK